MSVTQVRRLTALLLGIALSVIIASPTLGYGKANDKNVQLTATGTCSAGTLDAFVTNKDGTPSPATPVTFRLLNPRPGDSQPTPSTSNTNASGHAFSSYSNNCTRPGARVYRACVPETGTTSPKSQAACDTAVVKPATAASAAGAKAGALRSGLAGRFGLRARSIGWRFAIS